MQRLRQATAGPSAVRATVASAHRVVPADVGTEFPREHELQWVVSADHALSVVSLQWMFQAAEIEGLPLKPGWKLSARSLATLSQKGHIHVSWEGLTRRSILHARPALLFAGGGELWEVQVRFRVPRVWHVALFTHMLPVAFWYVFAVLPFRRR